MVRSIIEFFLPILSNNQNWKTLPIIPPMLRKDTSNDGDPEFRNSFLRRSVFDPPQIHEKCRIGKLTWILYSHKNEVEWKVIEILFNFPLIHKGAYQLHLHRAAEIFQSSFYQTIWNQFRFQLMSFEYKTIHFVAIKKNCGFYLKTYVTFIVRQLKNWVRQKLLSGIIKLCFGNLVYKYLNILLKAMAM